MTITTLLSGLPQRTMDQATFDQAMANLMTNLPIWGQQVNTTEANMNAFAAGGAYAIPLTIDLSATTDVNPGTGKIRFDNATQNAATTLRINTSGSNSVDYTGVLDTFDASTSTVKGTIRLVKMNDLTKFLIFNVTARVVQTGYRDISVTCVASSGTTPFANGDSVVLFFQRTGDIGQTGAAGASPTLAYMKFSDHRSSGTQGGSSVTGEQVRTLNNTDWNDLPGSVTLASNTVTLPAGTYEFHGRAPSSNSGGAQLRLYNVTDTAYALIGSTNFASTGGGQEDSVILGKFTITSSKQFQLKHYIATAASGFGLGNAANTGQTEVYAEIIFRKVA